VDYHGTAHASESARTVMAPEATLLVISPWDPGAVPLIDKAIRSSDLGLNPTNDGKVVRVPMPAPTEERRKEIVKHLHKALENHRTAVRNIRRDIKEAIDKLEKDKKISQDEQKTGAGRIGKNRARGNEEDRRFVAAKEREILRAEVIFSWRLSFRLKKFSSRVYPPHYMDDYQNKGLGNLLFRKSLILMSLRLCGQADTERCAAC